MMRTVNETMMTTVGVAFALAHLAKTEEAT